MIVKETQDGEKVRNIENQIAIRRIVWDAFFTPTEILKQIGINKQIIILIDVGCGIWYAT